ncbi:xaa-Pro aminopeptidase 2 [Garra rufa]|uniref:xaa-Pro aminopeptidase 2 n=1 Tax=Garra rufa TaxID=137080 RepID=UPI003CCEBAE1
MSSSGWILAVCLVVLQGGRHAAWAEEGSGSERNCSAIPPYLPPTAVNTTLRLRDLRASMISLNISAYIIPATDAHLSEYIAPRDARLAWMSGFTGSAGTAVITQNKAVLWTDSRYWIQAERQIDCNWELQRDASTRSITNWLILEIPEGDEVGFDPFLFSVGLKRAAVNSIAACEGLMPAEVLLLGNSSVRTAVRCECGF